MIRRLWPSSLYGQILLVTAVALLVAQGINAALLLSGSRVRAVVEASTMVVGRVVNQVERSREFGLPLDHEARRYTREPKPSRFRQNFTPIIVRTAPIAVPGFVSQPEMTERANEFLDQAAVGLRSAQLSLGPIELLPPELREALKRRTTGPQVGQMRRGKRGLSSQAVLLSVQAPDGRWIVTATGVRPNNGDSVWALLLQTLLLYVAVLVPLALVARRIARPLKALTDRVARVGFTGDNPPMEPRGPSDVRELIEAFNGAEARLSSLLTEKDVMLGAIGHDLKTPLASLRVRIENVDNDDDRDKMASTVEEMVTILDDILVLARLGKSAEEVQATDLTALVETVISDMPEEAAISFDPTERVVASVRPVLIRRALRNLVSNALQYGGDADIRIERGTSTISLVVEDRGPGIAPDQLEAIFEPFARADSSRNRASGGTGLGLTIARAIARAHRGDVCLQNRTEGGVRAELRLPV